MKSLETIRSYPQNVARTVDLWADIKERRLPTIHTRSGDVGEIVKFDILRGSVVYVKEGRKYRAQGKDVASIHSPLPGETIKPF